MTLSRALQRDQVPAFGLLGSSIRFEAHTPAARPDLWRAYLDGAEQRYRSHGLEWVLDRPNIEDGHDTSLFFVGIDPRDQVVSGLRATGPLRAPSDARLVDEFRASEHLPELVHHLEDWIAEGVVELKTGWVMAHALHRSALGGALARCCVYTMDLLGVRYACGAAAEHSRERWQSSGAHILQDVEAVPFPDTRYRTVVLWWDEADLDRRMLPMQFAHLQHERRQLRGQERP